MPRNDRHTVHRRRVSDIQSTQRGASARTRRPSVRSAVEPNNGSASASSTRAKRGETPDVSAYSRSSYKQKVTQRKGKRKKKIVIGALAVVLVALLGVGGFAFAYISNISGNLHRGVDDGLLGSLTGTQDIGEPFYMILMGVDGSAEREASKEYAGDSFRSDSMMLCRIDPQSKKATLLSLHRDTLIDMGENGNQKLNAAHAIGGPSYVVEVVSELAGVDISHYAEINFDGFKEIVDALGGVEVDVPMEIDDPQAGGHLDAGLQTLNGDQALILCRARHAYDDYGDGDRYRAANQRVVLGAIAEKILSADPVTLANTITALSKYVTTDLGVDEIITIANYMRGIDTSKDIYSGMEPTTPKEIRGTWYEILDLDAWQEMMQRVDEGLPPSEETVIDSTGTVMSNSGDGAVSSQGTVAAGHYTGTVAVRNGTTVSGAGAVAAEKIAELGFDTNVDDASDTDYTETVVVYSTNDRADEAQDIVEALGGGRAVLDDGKTYLIEDDFLVIIGSDTASSSS